MNENDEIRSPGRKKWALEVEVTHANRLSDILACIGYDAVCIHLSQKRAACSSLLYIDENALVHQSMPFECFKYVSRCFYVPHACRDPEWIFESEDFRRLLKPEVGGSPRLCLRLACSPKELEVNLDQMIFDAFETSLYDDNGSLTRRAVSLHPTQHDYVLTCIYSSSESMYRWGIVSKDEAEQQLMTSEALFSELTKRRLSSSASEPVCRAYFKIEEIVTSIMPLWGWQWPAGKPTEGGIVSIDVGASPGGWTQFLHTNCEAVLSVDPGDLRPHISSIDNVFHLQTLIQDKQVVDVFKSIEAGTARDLSLGIDVTGEHAPLNLATHQQVRVVVCDINCDAKLTGELLSTHVLPFIEGFGRCCSKHSCKCKDSDSISVSSQSGYCNANRSGSNCCSSSKFSCDDQEITSVLLIVTLKLLKNPKQRHIEQAVRQLMQHMDLVRPCSQCSRCQWTWDWTRIGSRLSAASSPSTDDCRLLHLCANSSNERTLVMRRRLTRVDSE